MTQAVARILADAEQLSPDERVDLADHLALGLADHAPNDIERAQLAEVRRRIARVEAGEVQLVPGEQVFAQGHALLDSLEEMRRAL